MLKKCIECERLITEDYKSPFNYDLCKVCDPDVYERVVSGVTNKSLLKAYKDYYREQGRKRQLPNALTEAMINKIIDKAINEGNLTQEQRIIAENEQIKECKKLEEAKKLAYVESNYWYYFPIRLKLSMLNKIEPLLWGGAIYFDIDKFLEYDTLLFKDTKKKLDLVVSFEKTRWYKLYCSPHDSLPLAPQPKFEIKTGDIVYNYYYDGLNLTKRRGKK